MSPARRRGMEQEPAESHEAPITRAISSRTRRTASYILLGFFCLVAPFTAVAVWARGEVLNTDNYVEAVDQLAADPVIQDAAATRVSEAIFERVDLNNRIAEALPGDQRILLGPITEAVQTWVTDEIDRFFASDEWQRIWEEVNRAAHKTLMAVLTGEGRGQIHVEGGKVILDLSPLVTNIESRLDERGLKIFDRITGGEPVNTEIVIIDSPELEKARRAIDLLDRFAIVLTFVVAALILCFFIVAPSKRKAIMQFGLALAISMAVLLALLALGRSFYLSGVDPESRRPVAAAFFDALSVRIRDGSRT